MDKEDLKAAALGIIVGTVMLIAMTLLSWRWLG